VPFHKWTSPFLSAFLFAVAPMRYTDINFTQYDTLWYLRKDKYSQCVSTTYLNIHKQIESTAAASWMNEHLFMRVLSGIEYNSKGEKGRRRKEGERKEERRETERERGKERKRGRREEKRERERERYFQDSSDRNSEYRRWTT